MIVLCTVSVTLSSVLWKVIGGQWNRSLLCCDIVSILLDWIYILCTVSISLSSVLWKVIGGQWNRSLCFRISVMKVFNFTLFFECKARRQRTWIIAGLEQFSFLIRKLFRENASLFNTDCKLLYYYNQWTERGFNNMHKFLIIKNLANLSNFWYNNLKKVNSWQSYLEQQLCSIYAWLT
jgi:hypothetical protein